MMEAEWGGCLLFVTLPCLVASLLYLYGTWTYSTWSRAGVSGPTPVPFLGNMREVTNKGYLRCLQDWEKKYGKTYGIYQLRIPVLVTTDLDILKEVFIKDFANFTDRMFPQPLFPVFPKMTNIGVAKGDQWRRQRHVLAPTFTASKLRVMEKFITRCCHNLSAAIGRHTEAGRPIDVKQLYNAYILDVICGTAFGLQTNALEQENNAFLNIAKRIITTSNTPFRLPHLIAGLFPFTHRLIQMTGYCDHNREDFTLLKDAILDLLNDRKKHRGKGHVDFLQLMVDAEATEDEISANPEAKRLTTDEVVAQGIVVFFASFETTSTALKYLTYQLALNPDKQEKLYQEILTTIRNDEASHDNVATCKYVDCCVREALRYMPPIPLISRVARTARTIKGVYIPEGAAVHVSIYGVTRDEDIFPDPETFLPERFDEETGDAIPSLVRDLAFGAGPRQCVAMRMAQFVIKMAIITVLRQFRFVKVPETPDRVMFLTDRVIPTAKQPVMVGAQLRQQENGLSKNTKNEG